MSIHQTLVELEVETRNFAHIREVETALNAAGYHIEGSARNSG
jgi:hypothetical protein